MVLGGPLPRSSCFGTRLPRKRNVHSYSKLCSKEFLKQWLLEEPIFLTVFFLLFRQRFRHFLPNGVILPIGKSWGRYFNLIIKTNKKLCNSDLYDVLNIPRLFQQVEFRSLNSLNFLYCPSVGFEMTKIFPVRPLATSKFPTFGWYKASLIPDDAGNCQKLRCQFFIIFYFIMYCQLLDNFYRNGHGQSFSLARNSFQPGCAAFAGQREKI